MFSLKKLYVNTFHGDQGKENIQGGVGKVGKCSVDICLINMPEPVNTENRGRKE